MIRYIILSGLIISFAFFGISLAEIPKLINYQGMLTDDAGTPLSGSYNLTFKIYDDTTGGTLKWSETQNGVQVQNGLFNIALGKVSALNLAFDQSYWLEVGLGAETMPRMRITSTGYAYRAWVADSARIAPIAPTGGGWTDNGEDIRLTTSTDNVGIGIDSSHVKLHIYDKKNGFAGIVIENPDTGVLSQEGIYFGAEGGLLAGIHVNNERSSYFPNQLSVWNNRTNGSIFLGAAEGFMKVESNGYVGIGTLSPSQMLHISDDKNDLVGIQITNLDAGSSSSEGIYFENENGTLAGMVLYDEGAISYPDHMRIFNNRPNGSIHLLTLGGALEITNSGYVGIGTSAPAYKTDVVGNRIRLRASTSAGAKEIMLRTDGAAIDLEANNGDLFIQSGTGNTVMQASGRNVGIGITGPTEKLDVNGTARLRGIPTGGGAAVLVDANGKLWKQNSSRRYKEKIKELEIDPEKVLLLNPVGFTWKTTGEEDIGLIAEEVEQALPDLVIHDGEGKPDAVKYDKVAIYLLKIVKDQQERISALEKEVAQLRK